MGNSSDTPNKFRLSTNIIELDEDILAYSKKLPYYACLPIQKRSIELTIVSKHYEMELFLLLATFENMNIQVYSYFGNFLGFHFILPLPFYTYFNSYYIQILLQAFYRVRTKLDVTSFKSVSVCSYVVKFIPFRLTCVGLKRHKEYLFKYPKTTCRAFLKIMTVDPSMESKIM